MRRLTLVLILLAACAKKPEQQHLDLFGDAQRGRAILPRYGCPACHEIPGVPMKGLVGPALAQMGRRAYIAGHIPNTQITLAQWIQHPQEMKPGVAMPDCGVNERDARDMAAYLFTLR